MSYTDQEIVAGSTSVFAAYVTLNDEVWDISGATVLLYLRDPSGDWDSAYTATVADGPNGYATATIPLTTFDEIGTWVYQWKFTVGSIVKWGQQTEFEVYPAYPN